MINFSYFKSLRVKILFSVLTISLVSFAIVIGNQLRSLDTLMESQTKLYTNGIFPLLNSAIAPLLFARDYASIKDVTDSFVDADTVEFVRIRDRSEKVVSLSGSIPANFSPEVEYSVLQDNIGVASRRLVLVDQWVGYVDYGYTMSTIINEQGVAINQSFITAVLAIALTMGILVIVISYSTRSLKHLANGARQVSNGDLSVKIYDSGHDEIAYTARAFNKMVISLLDARNRQENILAELKSQKEMLAVTQNIARMGYWRLHLQTNKIYFSEECRTIFGFESGFHECDFEQMFDIIHAEDVVKVREMFSESMSLPSSELNYRIILSSGVERTIYSKTELLHDKNSIPHTLLGIAQDVTERYKKEQAHRDSESRLRAAQKIASIGNIEWQVGDDIGVWTDEAYEVFGVTRDIFPPTYSSFVELIHSDDRDYVVDIVASSIDSEEAFEFEYRVSLANGEVRWVNAILKQEKNSKTSKAKISGIVQNISARKISEERAQLLQKQLQQSQKMEAIGQLTGGIAHDFNNILAVIMGYSRLALDGSIDTNRERLEEYLQEVYHAGERATELISQMMTFSRTSINEPRSISINPLVSDVCKMLSSILPSSIQIETHFEKDLSNILIDPVQLQQVIMNICINARDAMKGKGVLKITVKSKEFMVVKSTEDPKISGVFSSIISCESCHEVIKDGKYIELSIADDGHGIESAELAQIFEPFFTTKDVGKGTGMGLSMVHGIVHEHHGHILIKSIAGGGTSFSILFPISMPVETAQKPNILELGNARAGIENARILIVDDELTLAKYIAAVFEQVGGQAFVFTDSKQALKSYQENPTRYDMLVVDQTMPGLTGADISKVILASNPDFPIILCTGYSESLNEDQAIKIGIRKFLYKPVNSEILLNVANELLSQTQYTPTQKS